MHQQHTIVVVPAQRAITFGQTTVPVNSTAQAVKFCQDQAAILRNNYRINIIDVNDKTEFSRYYISPGGSHGTRKTSVDSACPVIEAPLYIDGWKLVIDDTVRETFYTLKEFLSHCQSIADTYVVSFKVMAVDVTPSQQQVELKFRPTAAQEPADDIDTGKLGLLLVEKESEPLQQATQIVAGGPGDEELLPVPDVLVDEAPLAGEDSEAETEAEPAPEPEAIPEAEVGPTDQLETLDELLLSSEPQNDDWGAEEEQKAFRFTAFVKSRKVMAAGAGLLIAVPLVCGFAYSAVTRADTPKPVEFTSSSVSIPQGYENVAQWSLPIPEDSRVHVGKAATALISSTEIKLYSNQTGELLRTVQISEPISEDSKNVIGSTIINGKDALIWEVGNQISVFTADMGKDGSLITAKVENNPTIYALGTAPLIKVEDKVYTVTESGLKEFKAPAGLTPMAVDEQTLVSGGFDVPILLTNLDGSSQERSLSPVSEDLYLNSYIHVGKGLVSSIWAEDPLAQCSETSQAACDLEAFLVVHSLESGEVTFSAETTLGEAKNAAWVDGYQGNVAVLGKVLIDPEGHSIGVLPEGQKAEKVKGYFVQTSAEGRSAYIDASASPASGSYMNSVILAQTDQSIIVQQGESINAYSRGGQ
ncbi:hypothetical protein [Rothia endophytica]|uniref:hypothetical protein n=1 Tax=Rothia endophytica TaxID=1324766 RepID=UPI001F18288A|nr:hypothetical protein [Rothia endophytica]